jgi:hypothetical protein
MQTGTPPAGRKPSSRKRRVLWARRRGARNHTKRHRLRDCQTTIRVFFTQSESQHAQASLPGNRHAFLSASRARQS